MLFGTIRPVLAAAFLCASAVASDTVRHSTTIGRYCLIRVPEAASFFPLQPADWHYDVLEGGTVCIVASGTESRTVVVLAFHGVDTASGIPRVVRHIVSVAGADIPDDGEDDRPSPDPENVFGVGKVAHDAAVGLDRAVAVRIADVWGKAAAHLQSLGGTEDDIQKTIYGIRDSIDKVLGDDAAQWTTWRTAVEDAFKAGWTSGKIVSRNDHVGAFREVESALR